MNWNMDAVTAGYLGLGAVVLFFGGYLFRKYVLERARRRAYGSASKGGWSSGNRTLTVGWMSLMGRKEKFVTEKTVSPDRSKILKPGGRNWMHFLRRRDRSSSVCRA